MLSIPLYNLDAGIGRDRIFKLSAQVGQVLVDVRLCFEIGLLCDLLRNDLTTRTEIFWGGNACRWRLR